MDKFVVSARKYRPQAFDTVVGQAHITTTLKNAIKNNQLAHAFLFCGPRGVGKTTCARILAKTINCENLQPDGEACNECTSCRTFNEGSSLNIHELDAASNNSVDDIRSLVEQVRFAPQAGKYKVYIVDEVHMLTASAFNAFLKTLEEPPSYAIFILATTEKHKILPTILSRCQIFDFKRITSADTVEHLESIAKKENINAEKAALQVIAQKSEGCMRDSLSILDKIVSFTNGDVSYQNTLEHLNILDHDYYFKLLDTLLQQDLATAMLLYDEINRKGFEGDLVLNGFAEFLRNLLVCKDKKAAALLDVMEGSQNKYITTAEKASTPYLISALNLLNDAEINFKMARNKRLHVELVLIKLNFLQQAVEFTTESGNVVKKKCLDVSAPTLLKVRRIQSFQVTPPATTKTNEPKLYIAEVTKPSTKTTSTQTSATTSTEEKKQAPVPGITITKERTKQTLLDALRKQYGEEYNIEAIPEAEPLNPEKLQECWNTYTQRLEAQERYSSFNAFKSATLSLENDIRFIVGCNSLTQQRQIELEKMAFTDEVQKAFNNRIITMQTIVEITAEQDVIKEPKQLNSRERFEKLATQNPAIRELKERLRLEIDY